MPVKKMKIKKAVERNPLGKFLDEERYWNRERMQDMGEGLEVSASLLCNIEAGGTKPKPYIKERYIKAYKPDPKKQATFEKAFEETLKEWESKE